MRIVKFTLIFLCLIIYLILGWIVRICMFFAKPHTVTKLMNQLTFILMHLFTTIGNLRIKVVGDKSVLKQNGLFIISTHIGYIDAVILGTLLPGSFTTKKEVKKIPLLGSVVSVGGSIFINRQKKSDIINYVNVMADLLEHKINVFNFPEGHATNGKSILAFFPSFFNAPLKAKASILPVSIDYVSVNGKENYDHDNVYCYDGKVSTIKHLWNLMNLKRVDITVTLHELIRLTDITVDSKNRNQVSELCMERLAAHKNLPIAKDHPLQIRS